MDHLALPENGSKVIIHARVKGKPAIMPVQWTCFFLVEELVDLTVLGSSVLVPQEALFVRKHRGEHHVFLQGSIEEVDANTLVYLRS